MSDFYEELSNRRKAAQEKGEYPEWYTTAGYSLFEQKYKYSASGFREQAQRIAKTAAKHLGEYAEEYEQKFFKLIWNGWLSCSTPVLSNMGTTRGMPVSCEGGYVEDSVDGFYTALHEQAVLSKHGFGTSVYLGDIRPRGTSISSGGKASGVLPVLKNFVQMSRDVSQGSNRRGAIASYLPIEHGDFWEAVEYLEQEPDDLNIGWNVSDAFVAKLEAGDYEALKRFKRVMRVKMVTGRGYFFFPDKVNRKRPEAYVKNNLSVLASNLCVAPETLILTDLGHAPIASLEDEFVNIWNGQQWSEVQIKKTGSNQKLLKVNTDSGYSLECTEYHKWYILDGYGKPCRQVRTIDLKPGDKLIKFDLPVVEGCEELERAYDNGFYSGDGCFYKGKQIIYLYHEKRKLQPLFENVRWNLQESQNRLVGYTYGLKEKFFVPINGYSVESRLNWLAGFLDADGCVYRNGTNEQLTASSINLVFLQEIQMMLQTLGVSAKITQFTEECVKQLPLNDGSGESGGFLCQKAWRLLITSCDTQKLLELGLNTHRLQVEKRTPQRDAKRHVIVTEVIDEGRVDDTYCFTEHKRGMGMFNGILTGQCSEITLHSNKEHSFTCVLSSMNLAKYAEWKDTDAVFTATVFLDCVASEFIERSQGIHGLKKARAFTIKGRALGLGVCGFATYLQENMIPFESFEAHNWNNLVFKQIEEQSKAASVWLAEVFGEPEWCFGLGVRNTHRLAIAPTKSTALLMGGVSEGINPDPAMTYTQAGAGGESQRINPTLLKIMKERGKNTKKHIQEIIDARGSVQGVTWLSEEEKLVFKTAFEIDMSAQLRLGAGRAKYLDQWQSLNLFFSAEEDPAYIAQIHKEAFLDERILGLYYCYSKAGVTAAKGECLACQ